jgi:hypothetical protein
MTRPDVFRARRRAVRSVLADAGALWADVHRLPFPISLTLDAKDIVWDPPKYLRRPGLGPSAWTRGDGK